MINKTYGGTFIWNLVILNRQDFFYPIRT